MVPKRTKTFTWSQDQFRDEPLAVTEQSGERFYIKEHKNETLLLPSITTVLGHFKKKSIMEWRKRVGVDEANRISGTAARRGTKIHRMVELYLRNCSMETVIEKASLTDIEMFNNMLPTLDRIDNIYIQERQLYSVSLGIAGRCDLIAEFDGVPSVIDFKTSLREKKREHIIDYFEQAAAYSMMFEYMNPGVLPVEDFTIIIANDESIEPQVFQGKVGEHIYRLCEKISDYRQQVKCDQYTI